MADRVVMLSIPQVRLVDVAPGALASLDRIARQGSLHGLIPSFPGLTNPAFNSLVSGRNASGHGIVGRAYYDRALNRVVGPPVLEDENQGNHVWEAARAARGELRSMLWFTPGCENASVEILGYVDSNGSTRISPARLSDELAQSCGTFPTEPAVALSGAPRIDQTSWILRSASQVLAREQPDLAIIRIPYLGHVARRHGPEGRVFARAIHDLDRVLGPFLTTAARDSTLIVATETISMSVGEPVDIHRILRKHDLLELRELEQGGTDINTETSPVIAVPSHQICHLYVRDRMRVPELVSLFTGPESDGIRWVLSGNQKARFGIDHHRSGDIVLICESDRWFRTDWWRQPAESPRGRKCPSGLDPESLRVVSDPVRVRGSQGAPVMGEHDRGILLISRSAVAPARPLLTSSEVAPVILSALGASAS